MQNYTTITNPIPLLEQLEQLIPKLYDSFATPIEAIGNSSIGDHIRHLIEFYQCLFQAIKQQQEVDYESRQRNQDLALIPEVALAELHRLKQILSQEIEDIPLLVQGAQSSLGREIQYAFDHAVHHCALIKAGLFVLQKKHLVADDFGVSPSTIRYRKSQLLLPT